MKPIGVKIIVTGAMKKSLPDRYEKNRPAVVLVLVLVVLVIVTSTVYSLSARISAQKFHQQYLIDYQIAHYSCDSAIKYALATIEELKPKVINRESYPEDLYDFSDLFHLNAEEYRQLKFDLAERLTEQLAIEAEQLANEEAEGETQRYGAQKSAKDITEAKTDFVRDYSLIPVSLFERLDPEDPNFADKYENEKYDEYEEGSVVDPESIVIPGPYGAPWPLVDDPLEFEIGSATVTIKIEDENAKMPLVWLMFNDKDKRKLAENALETFCEWMLMDVTEIEDLNEQLKQLSKEKYFSLQMKAATTTTKKTVPTTRTTRTSSSRNRASAAARARARTTKAKRPSVAHAADFAKLLHSSKIDLEQLAYPLPDIGERYESPAKYLAPWGSKKVNVNTAPRHVLETLFTFGGDAKEIADEIIRIRRKKPFESFDELQSSIYGYSDSITKVKDYLTTKSVFFSLKITAISGNAKVSAVATVLKEGNKFQKVAIIASR